jgi:hypothetical protein
LLNFSILQQIKESLIAVTDWLHVETAHPKRACNQPINAKAKAKAKARS